jgi:phenylacetate-CoA ligase
LEFDQKQLVKTINSLNFLFKYFWLLGSKLRNPKLNSIYNQLKHSEHYNSEIHNNQSFERVKQLLIFVQEKSNYYRNTFNEIGFDPNRDLNSLDDIKKLPVITKDILLKNGNDIHTNFQSEKVFLSETSGTSGQVLKFEKNENWDSFNRAILLYSYEQYDVRPWDRNGYFWGFNKSPKQRFKTQVFDFLQNRFRLFSYDKEEVERFLKKLKRAKYLGGYSSMIYETAKIALELGFTPSDFPDLKMIKGTSEKIYPYYQDAVIKAFGHKIISEYGAAETGVIAFEYPCGNMHVIEQNVLVEMGENGEAIVTNFSSHSFPIIRYSLGDSIKLNSEYTCTCGRTTAIIEEVEGRIGKSIFGRQEIYPSLTLYYIFKNLALVHNIELQYQGFQSKKGVLQLRFPIEISSSTALLIKTECKKYFNEDLEIELEDNFEIHTKKSKLRDFISELNQ